MAFIRYGVARLKPLKKQHLLGSYGAVWRGFLLSRIIRFGAARFPKMQNHTVRCCSVKLHRAVPCNKTPAKNHVFPHVCTPITMPPCQKGRVRCALSFLFLVLHEQPKPAYNFVAKKIETSFELSGAFAVRRPPTHTS